MTELGARRALVLPVRGAFHSPLMKSAEESLSKAIDNIQFKEGTCPIYQNITGMPYTDIEKIKQNLVNQLTSSVKWTQTMENMKLDGLTSITEVGPGKSPSRIIKRISRDLETKKFTSTDCFRSFPEFNKADNIGSILHLSYNFV